MEQLGIQNVKTLTRWRQAGVIPEPDIKKHPDGIGRISCWPQWVLAHCRVIKELTGKGQTLKEIAETFGSDWERVRRRYHKYRFSEVSQRMDLQNKLMAIRDAIDDSLFHGLDGIRQRLRASILSEINRLHVQQAIELAERGYNPVLIVNSQELAVTPDFCVGLHLSEYERVEPFVVIPLLSIILQHQKTNDQAKNSQIRAVPRVQRNLGSEISEESVRLKGNWGFHPIQLESDAK